MNEYNSTAQRAQPSRANTHVPQSAQYLEILMNDFKLLRYIALRRLEEADLSCLI